MIAMSLAEVAEVVGGTLHAVGGAEPEVVAPASCDSRDVSEGGLFVAVRGEHVDGHDYAGAAVRAGAVGVLGARPTGVPTVVVQDPVRALAGLARHVLSRLDELTVVALTGSQGKTGTKDLLAAVLGAVGTTVATRGNLNNEIGVPLTALRATRDTDYLVLEMGARAAGDIAYLCDVAPPEVSVVLNVGKAHLGEFGSRAAIAAAKGEIVEALGPGGTAVLNADDPLVAAMARRTRARCLAFGTGPDAEVGIEELAVDALGRARFALVHRGRSGAPERSTVGLRVLGEHQAYNAAAAAAAALATGVPLATAATALSGSDAGSPWRMELHELAGGTTLVNDAYNANPDSMRAALATLSSIARSRHGTRTVAVLGEMLELGPDAEDEHARLGTLAVELGLDRLVVVGEGARAAYTAARGEDAWHGEAVFVEDADRALAWLRANLTPADVVLTKASRDARLERVAEALVADAGGDQGDPGATGALGGTA